jgi:hypothetical protein
VFDQEGSAVTVTNAAWNATIAPGATLRGPGFIAGWDNATNPEATHFRLNGARCTSG